MSRPDATPHIAAVLAAQSGMPQPEATFAAVDRALAATTGHILFTILIHHPGLRENERYYTNMPNAYPIGGRKPMHDSPWVRKLIQAGEPYIGRTREDLKEVFFDHELIFSLGCESVLNMPVRWAGQTLGTVNLLHKAGWYEESDIPNARLFAQLAVPALLMISRR